MATLVRCEWFNKERRFRVEREMIDGVVDEFRWFREEVGKVITEGGVEDALDFLRDGMAQVIQDRIDALEEMKDALMRDCR